MAEDELKVQLVDVHGTTSIFIDARIDGEGNLVISGQDIGDAPKKFWGDSDYEYWVTVQSDQKDRLLLALLEYIYKDDRQVISKFRDFLAEKRIPADFQSWV